VGGSQSDLGENAGTGVPGAVGCSFGADPRTPASFLLVLAPSLTFAVPHICEGKLTSLSV